MPAAVQAKTPVPARKTTVAEQETLLGTVQKILTRKDTWGVVALTSKHKVACANLPQDLEEGDKITALGNWIDSKFGRQFKAFSVRKKTPIDNAGIIGWLKRNIDGIGDVRANALAATFGSGIFPIAKSHPARLLEVYGVTQQMVDDIHRAVTSADDADKLILFLQAHRMGGKDSHKCLELLDKTDQRSAFTFAEIEANPYLLTQVYGIGFAKADEVAMDCGIEKESEHRIIAGLEYTLSLFAQNGHTAATESDLIDYCARKVLCIGKDKIASKTASKAFLDKVVRVEVGGQVLFALESLYAAETRIADDIKRRLAAMPEVLRADIPADLDDDQRRGVEMVLKHRICVLTGGPGVGKTYTTNAALNAIEQAMPGANIILAAPTGKAALRMTESTRREATTIHRRIYTETLLNEMDDADVICIDEASMVDAKLCADMLDVVPVDCRIILVGDVDQLPSVGAGNVLKDLIDSGVPTTRLETIHRQAEDSMIAVNAAAIKRGEMPQVGGDFFMLHQPIDSNAARYVLAIVQKALASGIDISQIQVLAPMYDGECGVHAINKLIKDAINPSDSGVFANGSLMSVGDKVMNLKNDPEIDALNGDTGIIVSAGAVQGDDGRHYQQIQVQWEDGRVSSYGSDKFDQLTHAWCKTIHKVQGGEYNTGVFVLSRSHTNMLYRQLFYTGVTRPKVRCYCVGDTTLIERAVKNNRPAMRTTMLGYLLRGGE